MCSLLSNASYSALRNVMSKVMFCWVLLLLPIPLNYGKPYMCVFIRFLLTWVPSHDLYYIFSSLPYIINLFTPSTCNVFTSNIFSTNPQHPLAPWVGEPHSPPSLPSTSWLLHVDLLYSFLRESFLISLLSVSIVILKTLELTKFPMEVSSLLFPHPINVS